MSAPEQLAMELWKAAMDNIELPKFALKLGIATNDWKDLDPVVKDKYIRLAAFVERKVLIALILEIEKLEYFKPEAIYDFMEKRLEDLRKKNKELQRRMNGN